ncbi:hypothetical protein SAMN05421670_0472 [Psychrobacillus psychrotolerans]|uniref:Uncharacterized protein n=1 Tax=Psychrobacillus psychrotolerans TaxID=126156 RepID=A0A1I5UNG4_9BACI|nr:hypothetical protein [Psychrobacillus psychrotolerans]SFP96843.1 hypothetical protein SAMN05421670_0472 [Psychrobacillus psychrotolerans]
MKKSYLVFFLFLVLVGCQIEIDVSKQNKDHSQNDIQEEVETVEYTKIPSSLLNEISQQIGIRSEEIKEDDLLKVKSMNITSQNNDDVSAPIDVSSISLLN